MPEVAVDQRRRRSLGAWTDGSLTSVRASRGIRGCAPTRDSGRFKTRRRPWRSTRRGTGGSDPARTEG